MVIDSAVEAPTRLLFGHVLRDEMDGVETQLNVLVDAGYLDASLALTARISGIVAVDLCDGERPTDADIRELSSTLADLDDQHGLTDAGAHDYLARVVFGGERLDLVFSVEDATRVPYVVCSLLLASSAKTEDGQEWPDYLDQVEATVEAAPESS